MNIEKDDGLFWIPIKGYKRFNFHGYTLEEAVELYNALDTILWEEDTKIHNENIKQKS